MPSLALYYSILQWLGYHFEKINLSHWSFPLILQQTWPDTICFIFWKAPAWTCTSNLFSCVFLSFSSEPLLSVLLHGKFDDYPTHSSRNDVTNTGSFSSDVLSGCCSVPFYRKTTYHDPDMVSIPTVSVLWSLFYLTPLTKYNSSFTVWSRSYWIRLSSESVSVLVIYSDDPYCSGIHSSKLSPKLKPKIFSLNSSSVYLFNAMFKPLYAPTTYIPSWYYLELLLSLKSSRFLNILGLWKNFHVDMCYCIWTFRWRVTFDFPRLFCFLWHHKRWYYNLSLYVVYSQFL